MEIRMKILIADDDLNSLELINSALMHQGCTVFTATNGDDALRLAQTELPDLVVSETLLPSLDGYDLCRRFKSDGALSHIPFVFFSSASATPDDDFFASALGVVKFIAKTSSNERNIELMRKLIDEVRDERWQLREASGLYSPVVDAAQAKALANKLQSRVDELERERREFAINERSLRRINRMFQMLFESERVLTRSQHESELLSGICQLLVDVADYRLAWVGIASSDPDKSIEPIVSVGFEPGYLESIKLSWGDNEFGYGPSGMAIRTGQPFIVRDIQSDDRYRPWREEAEKRGYASSIAIPFNLDFAVAVLSIYSNEVDAFDETEVDLLKKLG